MKKSKSLFTIIMALLFSTAIVKVLNFLKEMQISYLYGTSDVVDYFNIVMIGPNIALSTIAPAFGLILVSYLSKEKKELNITVKEIVFFISMIVFLVLITIISQMNYVGYEILGIILGILVSCLFMIQVIMVYYLQSFQAFNQGSISSIVQIVINLLVISFSIFLESYLLLLFGLILGLVCQLIYLFYVIRRNAFVSTMKIKSSSSNDFYHSFFSVVLGYGLIEMLISLQKSFAVGFEIEGLISAINYSYKVMNLPISIFLFAVLSVLFPKMTQVKDMNELDGISTKLLGGIAFIMLPASIIFFWKSEFIISVLFERGSFNRESVILTAFQLKCFSLMLLPLSLFSAQLRIIFVRKEWGKIYFSAVIILIITIMLNVIATIYSSITLLSLSLPLAYSITVAIIFRQSLIRSVDRDLKSTLISTIVMLISIMLISKSYVVEINELLSIIIIMFMYILMQYLLKNTLILKMLRR